MLAADGSYTYTPNAARAGARRRRDGAATSFSYTASDGTASDTATLTVTVTGLNDAPVANDDTDSTTEDAAVSGNVLANDTDVDVETADGDEPGHLRRRLRHARPRRRRQLHLHAQRGRRRRSTTARRSNDVFSYTASDGTASDTATLTITVTGLNDAPVANDDTASTTEDAAVSGNVLTNDTDVDVEPLTVTNPGTYVGTYGTLVLAADGSYTYTPNAAADGLAAGETAQDVFSYTASDGTASDTATLTVTVNGTNDAPTIDAGGTDATRLGHRAAQQRSQRERLHPHRQRHGRVRRRRPVRHPQRQLHAAGRRLSRHLHARSGQPGRRQRRLGLQRRGRDARLPRRRRDADPDLHGRDRRRQWRHRHPGRHHHHHRRRRRIGPQTVWYIDNSAVGSANIGTQADPFTSIAAFNAAQGTLGGPQVGAQRLPARGHRHRYAEADGINLLDDQILTGVADGPAAADHRHHRRRRHRTSPRTTMSRASTSATPAAPTSPTAAARVGT